MRGMASDPVKARCAWPGAMMNRERLDGWCEKGILALVLVILVFGPLALGAVETWQWLVIQGLTLGVMALWGVRLCVSGRPRILWPPVCWAVLAFTGYAMVRYCQADIEYVARQELIQIVVYAFLFLAILNNVQRAELTQVLVLTLVFLGMALAMYACWQFVKRSDAVWNLHSGYLGRGSGTFGYPNSLAAFLEILVPVGLSCVLMGRLSHATKIFAGYAVVAMLAGIGVTMSRGGWLVVMVILPLLCIVLLTQRDYRLQALVLAGGLLLGGAFVVPKANLAQQRLKATLSGEQVDDIRLALWQTGLRMWQDNFWWGMGPAHFDYRFREYRPEMVQRRPDHVHNDYLNTLVDYGVAGAALVAAAWGLLWFGMFKSWNAVRGARDDFARKKSNRFALLVGGGVGLVAILLHSVFDFNLHIPAIAILTVTLMALLAGQTRFATENCWHSGKWVKWVMLAVLAAGIGGLGYAGWRSAREDAWLRQAAREREFSVARQTALEKAWAVEPMNFETTYEIGENYRTRSFLNLGDDPDALAKTAMEWYRRGMKLNRYDGYNWLRYGMCLDWVEPDENTGKEDAAMYYRKADELDPNGGFTAANMGWHYMMTGDYAAARDWFERSLRLIWLDNTIAASYLPIAERRLAEAALKQRKPGENSVAGSP